MRVQRTHSAAAALLAPFLLLAGCAEYTIETTLRSDGSGLREEAVEVTPNEEVHLQPEDFVRLLSVGPEEGWSHRSTVEADGDTVHVFERTTRIPGLAAWSTLNDRVSIAGTVPQRAGQRIGHVSLGTVRFHNLVQVETGRTSDGDRTFAYRETFRWENGADALVEFVLEDFDRRLAGRYPALTDRQRGEIVGTARARLWSAVEEGYFFAEGEEETRLLAEAVEGASRLATKVVRTRYPDADPGFMTATLRELLSGNDDQLETLFEETLPGFNLAFNSEIRFHLTMPGRVTETNAEDEAGGTLVWEFGPLDALTRPVEIYATSVVAR